MMRAKITKGVNYYFYETEDLTKVCPKCKREYKSRKLCLDCFKKTGEKIPTEIHKKLHTGMITKDLKKYSCDCVWGSFSRWGHMWRTIYKNSNCKHSKLAIKELKKVM